MTRDLPIGRVLVDLKARRRADIIEWTKQTEDAASFLEAVSTLRRLGMITVESDGRVLKLTQEGERAAELEGG